MTYNVFGIISHKNVSISHVNNYLIKLLQITNVIINLKDVLRLDRAVINMGLAALMIKQFAII